MATGFFKFIANFSIISNSSKFFGAITTKFGMVFKNAKSNIPWWVSPSAPTIPALSTQIVTGKFCKAISWINWSYALCKKDEYTANTGFNPPFAIPPIKPTACCSVIPTSKNLLGNSFAKSLKPVPSFIAAVTATILLSFFASSTSLFPKTLE